jgi:hypothetical protein
MPTWHVEIDDVDDVSFCKLLNALGKRADKGILCKVWPRGTSFSQLPSAVISTADHPLGSPSLLK